MSFKRIVNSGLFSVKKSLDLLQVDLRLGILRATTYKAASTRATSDLHSITGGICY